MQTQVALPHTHRRFIIAILALALIVLGVRFLTVDLHPASDTREYVETAQHLAGDTQAPVHGHRLLKPLAPIIMSLVAPLTGGDYEHALLLMSVLFYILLGVLVYSFAYYFLEDRWGAFFAGVLYITSYPILMYGLDLYTETGAWFFHLLGLYFAFQYYTTPTTKLVVCSAIATTIGFLWKEYAALAGIALISMILATQSTWRQKSIHLVVAALIALPILIGWQWYVYDTYAYTYLDWFRVGQGEPDATSEFSFFYIGKSLFALLLLGWFFVIGGILRWKSLNPQKRIPLLTAGITSLGFLAWGYVSSRLYFVLTPTLVVLAGSGLAVLRTRWIQVVVVCSIVSTNILWLLLANNPMVRAWLTSF